MSRQRSPFLRFIVAGTLNTVITYALFLYASAYLHHIIAYTLVYVVGILLSYMLNTLFVFRTTASWATAALFPLVYVLQYIWGVGLLFLLVDVFDFRSDLSILVVIGSSVFLTYGLTRQVLRVGAK